MKNLFFKLKFSPWFSRFRNSLLLNDREKIIDLAMSFVKSNSIQGDYLEFGVYKGTSFIRAYTLANVYKLKDMNFFAFDSFKGLPKIRGKDVTTYNQFRTGTFKFSETDFLNTLKKYNLDLNRVTIVPGFFNVSLTKNIKIKNAAIINIDCDLYESTRSVLNFVSDVVQDGTIILFDDWFCFKGNPEKGEQKAFSEWINKTKGLSATEFRKYGWHGNSFIIHR